MVDNKVVIRINYDRDKNQKKTIDPKMVTVWHKGRIFFALLLMSSLIFVLLILLTDNSSEQAGYQASQSDIKPASDSVIEYNGQFPQKAQINGDNASPQNDLAVKNIIISKPLGIILNKRVIRASVNRSEDGSGNQTSAIVDSIIHLDQNSNQQTLSYFSEVKGVKESSLFHRWLKNGQIVHAKQFTIKDRKGKLLSSRKLGFKDIGQWEIMLIDRHEKVWSRSSFEISQH